jgi:putative transposase
MSPFLPPAQQDDHLWTVWRYVERNALRAGLVERAELWPWCSLEMRERGAAPPWLSAGPMPLPGGWLKYVNGVETEALRRCATRGVPCGDEQWQRQTVEQLGLETTLRPRGRPRKTPPTV